MGLSVSELARALTELVKLGYGDVPVYTASDDEGNNYNELWSTPEVKDPNDEEYIDEYGWHEDFPDTMVVVL